MKQFSFNSIFTRLTYWFLFLTLVPLIFGLSIAYNHGTEIIESRTINKLIAIRDLKVNRLKDWLTEREGNMKMIQNETELINLETLINKSSYNDNATLNIARNYLKNYLNNYPAYSELYVINPINGNILISTNVQIEGENRSSDDSFILPMQSRKLNIKDVYYSIKLSQFTIDYSIPIFSKGNSNNPIVGILVANIDLDNSLYKILNDMVGLGETGETLIVNKDLFAINQLLWFKDAPLSLQLSALPTIKASEGKTGILETIDYRDEPILSAYTYIPEMGWGFVCKQDIYELNAPIRDMTLNFIVIFIITTTVILLFTMSISKTITKPIIELNKTAIKISTGNYSIKSTINSKDEIGSLSESLNEMAISIKSKIYIQEEIANIYRKMIEESELHTFSSELIKLLTEITKANWSVFYVLDELNFEFYPSLSLGVKKELIKSVSIKNSKDNFGLALSKKGVFHLRDFPQDTFCDFQKTDDFSKPKEIITIPIVVEGIIVAFVLLAKNKSFNKDSYAIIEQSKSNINAIYSNLISNLRVGVLAENVLKINDKLDKQTKQLKTQNVTMLEQKIIMEELNKELEAFSYSVSHDLRAPIRHIDGFTKLLYKNIETKIDKKSQSYFDHIISSSKQMNTLIDDLLLFSRMGRKNIIRENINMEKIVDDALQTFTMDIKKNNISINIDKMPIVNVDASLITQVWINLISNAIKFSSNIKSPEIRIGIDKDSKSNTMYYIKDNGVGFNQKYVDKVFGVFQRLHSVNEFPGTGIGLANVKRIIVKHRGKIWAEGKINKGASFFFTLPNA